MFSLNAPSYWSLIANFTIFLNHYLASYNVNLKFVVFIFQKCGIESLVDELCQKLKDFESNVTTQTYENKSPCKEMILQNITEDNMVDLAAKYYAAFPALGTRERFRQQMVHQWSTNETSHVQARTMGNNVDPTSLIGDEGYSTNSDHETSDTVAPDFEHEELDLEYEDLPVDIRGLLASPVSPPIQSDRRSKQIPIVAQNRPYIRCGTNITSSIWSQDVEDMQQPLPSSPPFLAASRWSDGGDRRLASLLQLNHGGESSCFAEVLPGEIPRFHVAAAVKSRSPTNQSASNEDLLTSARTHFRPIRQETGCNGNASSNPTTGATQAYADGTTFAICGSLEDVPYKRTDSGTLYLQQDVSSSPKRYLEWRSTSPSEKAQFTISSQDKCGFVLRFHVIQNEKYCQTDELQLSDDEDGNSTGDNCATSGEETPPVKKRVLSEPSYDDDCELYFPGDAELLNDQWQIGGCTQCGTCEVWGAACPACAPQVPQRRTTHRHDLRRLRDELSREGDQLLNDLQRIVLLPSVAESVPQSQPIISVQPTDHRKRRHSGAPVALQRLPWLPNTSIIPQQHLQLLLRPVTL